MLSNDTGILIFALGNPQYGRMAFNLALTLRAAAQGAALNIAVIYNRGSLSHLSERQLRLFTKLIELPEGETFCNVKLRAFDVTPFENTLLLDADMVWLPGNDPAKLFEQLRDVDFTAITEARANPDGTIDNPVGKYFFWADPLEIRQQYPLTAPHTIYQWRSEVVWFKKIQSVKTLFNRARAIHAEAPTMLKTLQAYASGVADELALNIAAAEQPLHPHVYRWQPAFWNLLHSGGAVPELSSVYSRYLLASFGGHITNEPAKLLYNRVVKRAAYQLDMQHVFPLVAKKEWLKNRQKN